MQRQTRGGHPLGSVALVLGLAGGLLLGPVGCDGGTDPASTPDASTSGWQPLVSKTWTLAPGEERTSDLEIANIDRDLVIVGMRPLSPPGTHHTLLARGLSNTNIIYASGVGTNELMFPPGTGLRLTEGTLLGLQLHIFNTTDAPLTGTSGIEVQLADPAAVIAEVDLFLPGPRNLSLPPLETSSVSGTCTVKAAQSIFALFPHMHQFGTHFKTTLTIGGAPRVLHDAPYSFEHQEFISFDPIQLAAGDTITTECTWNNTTAATVTYGESSTTEMCYSILFRYPGDGDEFCTQ